MDINSSYKGVLTGLNAAPQEVRPVALPVNPSVAQATESSASLSKVDSRAEVESAVATIQDYVQSSRRSLNFSLEEGSGQVVVKVTDAGSGDIIRQIPSEQALQLAESLSEVRSLLFKAEA